MLYLGVFCFYIQYFAMLWTTYIKFFICNLSVKCLMYIEDLNTRQVQFFNNVPDFRCFLKKILKFTKKYLKTGECIWILILQISDVSSSSAFKILHTIVLAIFTFSVNVLIQCYVFCVLSESLSIYLLPNQNNNCYSQLNMEGKCSELQFIQILAYNKNWVLIYVVFDAPKLLVYTLLPLCR